MLEKLIGVVLDEKYLIEKQLGQGGMGAVYLATHLGTDRPVALKVIAPQYMSNEEFVERFRREAKAAGRLHHVNVVNVTDFGFAKLSQGNIAYLVMEYLSGCSLAEFLKKKGKLPLAFVLDIIEQVCLAIGEAHKQGIIHRDLKPDNIWLEPNGRGSYNVKVLDFGLAKLYEQTTFIPTKETNKLNQDSQNNFTLQQTNISALILKQENISSQFTEAQTQISPQFTEEETLAQPNLLLTNDKTKTQNNLKSTKPSLTKNENNLSEYQTQNGAILGTPLYMSPEQCLGKNLNIASDIYSLGVITYEMLASERPFLGNTSELIKQHIESLPPPLEIKRRDIPKAVGRLIMSALAKNPDERPESLTAFAITLRANSEGEKPLIEEAKKIHNKNRWLFISLALFTHTLVISLAIVVSLAHKWGFIFVFPVILFANSLNIASSALVINKLRLEPSNPIKLRDLLTKFIKYLPKLFLTSGQNLLAIFAGLLKLIVGTIKVFFDNSLHPIVVIVESKNGKLALERSKTLTSRLSIISKKLQIYDFFLAVLLYSVFLTLIWFEFWSEGKDPTYSNVWPDSIAFLIIDYITFLTVFLILSITHQVNAIAQNLLYLKSCQISNETFAQRLETLFELGGTRTTPQASFWQTLKIFLTPLPKILLGLILGLSLSIAIVIFLAYTGLAVDENIIVANSTLLLEAAKQGNNETVKTLITEGNNVNQIDAYGRNALMLAAAEGRLETVKLLIDLGSNTDAKDKYGKTSLIYAATEGRVEIIKVLLAAGNDINTKDNTGRTAIYYSKEANYTYATQILKESGALE